MWVSENEKVNLVLDIGNSSVKAGIFEKDQLLETFRKASLDDRDIVDLKTRYPLSGLMVCSVRNSSVPQKDKLQQHFDHYLELSGNTPLPIRNLYETPDTQGKDRIAAVVGGQALHPDRNLLIIDAGTAITFDFLSKEGNYLGGNISPGLSMRFRVLHEATHNLPLVGPGQKTGLLGTNTTDAIAAGVQNGILFEMNHYIENLKHQYGDLTTILTGGDSNFFDNKLKYPIFVESNLVLIGLNKILKYNIYAK